ncbi:MAG TPA: ribosome maturation factor RimP [bacterium]
MNNADLEKITALVQGIVEDMNMRLYDVQFNPVSRILSVFIDKTAGGVTVDDCRRVSSQFSQELDSADLIPSSYTLEVSSPGINRALKKLDHYKWALGKIAEIDLGKTRIKGHLRDVNESGVTIATDSGEEYIAFSTIVRARVMEEIEHGKRR